MDSLTARHLARELDARWRGGRIAACVLDADRRRVVVAVERAAPVAFELGDPDVPVRETTAPPAGGAMQGWLVRGVTAPEDDRRVVIELGRPGKFRGSPERRAWLEISALPTARGAVLRDAGGARLAAIGARLPRSAPPRPLPDDGELARAAARGDVQAMSRWRWMSAATAAWLAREPERAAERYRELAEGAPRPSRCGDRVLPFPLCEDATPAASLVLGLEAEGTATPEPARDGRTARALARLRRELERSRAAPLLREAAGLLLALGDAAAPTEVTLSSGDRVPVSPRPGEGAMAAAERLFGEARSMERALERLPARIAELEAAPAEAPGAAPSGRDDSSGGTPRPERALPYRSYRSSGGLDIWVGRGARANDELTFHAASPDDVWLHARDAAGAHVVLRWQRDEPPPTRDLEEAALLAAWHSRSRGSTVVPVDWTRRKYVRKPRGAAPGLVLLQRADTLFVRPEPAVLRRLMGKR
ncbi:MAG TPA: NFACT RNA binding domain-containing protein [Gemmatimonadaceae bacterium]|nr:NFACT RNA binding domain-containing protein [Gemmatimonadaceae bacterium]